MEQGNTTQSRGRRRRVLIVLAVCVLVGIGVVAFWPREREPEYQGKKLSEWVQPYTWRMDDVESENRLIVEKRRVADDAMQHMGTNALHWLVRWIAYEPPTWEDKIRGIVWKLPKGAARRWYARWCFDDVQLNWDAKFAFQALGTNAVAAVPELDRVVKTSPYARARDEALFALSYVEPDALPRLLEALEDQKLRQGAADCILRKFRTDGIDISAAIPALLLMDRQTEERAKEDRMAHPGPQSFERDYFYRLSGLTDQNPPFLLSALTNCLHHTNSDVRVQAAKNLGNLGAKAHPAVPALREALDDRAVAVQEAAIEALERISPEVLTNGVKNF